MWETKRLDGKRKLVHNAVPTLFWQYVKNATVTNPDGIEKALIDIRPAEAMNDIRPAEAMNDIRPVEAMNESIVEPQNVQVG